jgi:hypothetical protein
MLRLERVDADTFVDRGMPADERIQLADVLSEARQRVTAFYGSSTSDPRVLVCSTESCYRNIGGHGERGKAFLHFALILSPRGFNPVIATHELSHIEFHGRLGFRRSLTNAIPAWFDEGLAVIVSNDQRYLAPPEAPDRCLVKTDKPLPGTMSEWNSAAGKQDSHVYAEAACRVSEWMSKRDGSRGVANLVRMVSAGMPFARVYEQR